MAWWLLQSLVTAVVLAALVQIICRCARIGPVARHALWVVVLVKLLTPPLVVWPWAVPQLAILSPQGPTSPKSPDGQKSPQGPESPVLFGLSELSELSEPSGHSELSGPASDDAVPSSVVPSDYGLSVVSLLVPIWIAGAAIFALAQLALIAGVLLKLRRATPADPLLADRVERLAERLRVRPIPIRVVAGIASPFVWSGWRPILLWPRDLPSNLSPACLDGLVVHELAHVKRRDHWVGWLELVAGCAWWWNPLFWYVRSQLREQAELACDAWVVSVLPHGRRAYAEALIAVCDSFARGTAPLPVLGVGASSRQALERRLTMIMRGRVPFRLSRLGYVSIALVTIAALPAVAQQSAAPPDQRVVPTEVRPDPAVHQRLQQLGLEVAPEQARTAERRPAQTHDEELVALGLRQRVAVDRRQAAALPEDAKKLIDQFGTDEDKILKDADAAIAEKRDQTIKQLQALQDAQTKAGHLDEALAIRSSIRQLEQAVNSRLIHRTASPEFQPIADLFRSVDSKPVADLFRSIDRTALSHTLATRPSTRPSLANNARLASSARLAPMNLSRYRTQVGETFTFSVVGSTSGSVWGDGTYTTDSSLAAAAVHAGVLKEGERGSVKVTILPGRDHYEASERNGVRSEAFGKFEGSFKVERAK